MTSLLLRFVMSINAISFPRSHERKRPLQVPERN